MKHQKIVRGDTMNNAVSYAIDSQVIFNTFFSIMAIVVAIGVSILVIRLMRKFIDFILRQYQSVFQMCSDKIKKKKTQPFKYRKSYTPFLRGSKMTLESQKTENGKGY